MAGNEPLPADIFVRVAVARFYDCSSLGKREGVKASVESGVATDLDEALIDDPPGLAFEEVLKVVLLFRGRKPWLVGNRW